MLLTKDTCVQFAKIAMTSFRAHFWTITELFKSMKQPDHEAV